MRKLAPMFVMTSIVALVGGNALAATDKTVTTTTGASANVSTVNGSPTVDPNTKNPQGLSYSDKSNTSPGTNAIMDDKAKVAASMEEDKTLTKKKKAKKAKVASNTTLSNGSASSGTSMSATSPTPTPQMNNPRTPSTSGAASNSVTGQSPGGDGGSAGAGAGGSAGSSGSSR